MAQPQTPSFRRLFAFRSRTETSSYTYQCNAIMTV